MIAYFVSIAVHKAVTCAVKSSSSICAVTVVVGGCGIEVASGRRGATGYFERVADAVCIGIYKAVSGTIVVGVCIIAVSIICCVCFIVARRFILAS